jgi:hypothetical protein
MFGLSQQTHSNLSRLHASCNTQKVSERDGVGDAVGCLLVIIYRLNPVAKIAKCFFNALSSKARRLSASPHAN